MSAAFSTEKDWDFLFDENPMPKREINMPSINVEFNFLEHPKTRRLVGLLGEGSELFPIRLWLYCAKFHPADGVLTNYSVQEIEGILYWKGESGKCLSALLKVGFVEKSGSNYQVHDWLGNESHIVSYHQRAKKGATARWGKTEPYGESASNASSNAKLDSKQCPYSTVHNLQYITIHNLHTDASLPFSVQKFSNERFCQSWNGWILDRKERRKPLTERAAKIQLRFLSEQPDPTACVLQAIENGWQKFYPFKEDKPKTEKLHYGHPATQGSSMQVHLRHEQEQEAKS